MGQAMLADLSFRLDPESISWTFSVKTKVTYTIGGKVVQVFGTKIDDMTVTGSFGQGGFDEQEEFVKKITALSKAQARQPEQAPHRFFFPQRSWDFKVYIKGLSTPDGSRSASVQPEVYNPKFILILKIVEENGGLKQKATDRYIERLSQGIGWTPNEFNGPIDYTTMRAEMQSAGAAVAAAAPSAGAIQSQDTGG